MVERIDCRKIIPLLRDRFARLQVLLQLAHGIFEEQSDLDKCMHNIMMEAQELLHCDRCMVFLIDETVEDVSSIADRVLQLRNPIN